MLSGKIETKGSFRKLLPNAGKGGVDAVNVGFFDTARYQDGTPVAAVAFWNEYGTPAYTITPRNAGGVLVFTGADGEKVVAQSVNHPGIPSRPFFRNALDDIETSDPRYDQILEAITDPETMTVDRQGAESLGLYVQGKVQQSIVNLKEPENKPSTKAAKGGKSNPLVNANVMRQSVTFEVEG